MDWTATKAPESGVNAYMEALVKETVMLHKVLSRYLAAPIVEVRTARFALRRSASIGGHADRILRDRFAISPSLVLGRVRYFSM